MSLNCWTIPTRLGVFKLNCKGLACLLVFIVSVCGNASGMCPTACICASDIVSCTNKNLSRVISSIITGSFSTTPNLKYLDLSSNNLKTLGSPLFQELRALEVLLLYNNQITQIESSAFGGLYKLQKLYLSYNLLSHFPLDLYVGKHKLTELEKNVLKIIYCQSLNSVSSF
uniref:Uncharacterized protein n=1 Tax=Apteryx owenii TaxID=8824 RepID=A0A8B9PGZ0_APTOW